MKKYWDKKIKNQAKFLRRKGYSYGQLTKELGVAKSTLHQWIRGIKRPKKFTKLDRIRFIKEIQPLAIERNRKKREETINKIISEIKIELNNIEINQSIKKIILSMLYWAEGSKTTGGMCFANTDPRLVLIFVTFLRSCYKLDENRLRVRLHLHYYHKIKKVRKFWSELLKIPEKQFEKVHRKKRNKEKTFRRNFGGICFVRYHSVYLKEKIVQYGYAFGEKAIGKIKVPVA